MTSNSSSPTGSDDDDDQRERWVPAWSHPGWADDDEQGGHRAQTDFKITDGFLDLVRPALRPEDEDKKPSEYAKRFGIFPGRTDGRSRASPVGETSWTTGVEDSGSRSKGHEIRHFLRGNAKGHGLDDYVKARRLERSDFGDEELGFLKAYENLKVDEYWQGVLFGDMTMEEMIDGGHFSMGHANLDLEGHIHPLLHRHHWENRDVIFTGIDGQVYTLNPKTNDQIWLALQPALRLATKLLTVDEPFFKALSDIRHWCFVDPSLDPRPHGQEREQQPRVKFKLNPDPSETICSTIPLPSSSFDPIANNQILLEKELVFTLDSGFHMDKFDMKRFTQGTTVTDFAMPEVRVSIGLAADVIWPLLASEYSLAEKMMTSHVLATTIVHEMMHAIECVIFKWLKYPSVIGITDPEDVQFCQNMRNALFPGPDNPHNCLKPYFEDDHVAETGHAYEYHVMGGGVWPLRCSDQRAGPIFLTSYAGINLRSQWGFSYDPEETLNAIASRPRGYVSFAQVDAVQKAFHQSFWDVQVQKYGMAAWREAPERPSKVWFCPPDEYSLISQVKSLTFGSQAQREAIVDFLQDFYNNKQFTLLQYCLSLVSEAVQFELMIRRFKQDQESRPQRRQVIENTILDIEMIVCEAAAAKTYADSFANGAWLGLVAAKAYETWQKLLIRKKNVFPDEESKQCAGALGEFGRRAFAQQKTFQDRIVRRLMQLSWYYRDEQTTDHGLISELYGLPHPYWQLYRRVLLPGHHDAWRGHVQMLQSRLVSVMRQLASISEELPLWDTEWSPKLTTTLGGFTRILEILGKSSRTVHKNWQRSLVTLPELRMCGTRPRERWYFLAKKEMLNLKGHQYKKLRVFERQFRALLDLGDAAIIYRNKKAIELATKWHGLLDDEIESQRSWMEITKDLGSEELGLTLVKMKEESKLTEMRREARAADFAAGRETRLQPNESKDHIKRPAGLGTAPPRLDRPSLTDPPTPLGISQTKSQPDAWLYPRHRVHDTSRRPPKFSPEDVENILSKSDFLRPNPISAPAKTPGHVASSIQKQRLQHRDLLEAAQRELEQGRHDLKLAEQAERILVQEQIRQETEAARKPPRLPDDAHEDSGRTAEGGDSARSTLAAGGSRKRRGVTLENSGRRRVRFAHRDEEAVFETETEEEEVEEEERPNRGFCDWLFDWFYGWYT
ncbi:hypothetical protein S40288_05503 [Stachybotrys chartarum IBT 40288]|nr:hypothetical protein S40288_05503 [Stachybotrys chartarum IBT 40288]